MRELVFYHEEEGVIVICGNKSKNLSRVNYIDYGMNEDKGAMFPNRIAAYGYEPMTMSDDFVLLGEL